MIAETEENMKKIAFSIFAASLLALGACSESTDDTKSVAAPASTPAPQPVAKEEPQPSKVEVIKEKAAEKVEEVKAVAAEKVEVVKETAAEKVEEVKESAVDKLKSLKDKY